MLIVTEKIKIYTHKFFFFILSGNSEKVNIGMYISRLVFFSAMNIYSDETPFVYATQIPTSLRNIINKIAKFVLNEKNALILIGFNIK